MLTDEQLTRRVRAALEKESAEIVPPPRLLANIHEELRTLPAAGRRRWRASGGPRLPLGHLAPIAGLAVVLAVVAVFLGVHGRGPGRSAAAQGSVTLVFRAEPTAQTPKVTPAVLHRAVDVMIQRVDQLGVSGAHFSTQGNNQISVRLPDVPNTKRAEALLGTSARLEFYDWEANAITSTGRSVASLLTTQDPTAIQISQGGGSLAPGSPGAGGMPLYQAVKLAAREPKQISASNARFGAEYFAFGAPGSADCAAASAAYHTTPIAGEHCYLAGPEDNLSGLRAAIPPGVSSSSNGAQTLAVQQGWVVLQAVFPGGFSHELAWSDPAAQYFVLRDHVALFGNEITNPRQSVDPSRQPDVQFGFTGAGVRAFQNVTAQIAHRGELVSGFGQTLNQHFAVALDTQLITVPSIDFKTYPDGIPGAYGGDITGGFTLSSARDLAAQLRLGSLPVRLKLIAEEVHRR